MTGTILGVADRGSEHDRPRRQADAVRRNDADGLRRGEPDGSRRGEPDGGRLRERDGAHGVRAAAAQRVRTAAPQRVKAALADRVADDFRPDVEGLRALAVVLVICFHARWNSFSGGFIGVDVFFVVSGFLITRLLLKEMASTGKISLPAFWARRARRLLPAAALTLVVTLLLARWILPPLRNREVMLDGIAVAGFVGNFRFASTLGDYFGANAGDIAPSPLLHYWSLAVEEQFYLLWPATMLLLTRRPRQFRRLLTTVIVAACAVSLVVSWWMTEHHPVPAYYLLPARVNELLAGALLAVAGAAVTRWSPVVRGALGWAGLLAIMVAAIFYDGSVAFPGVAALLPVVGTMAVIVGGTSPTWVNGPGQILNLPVMQWIGKHSYALYLWHWPVLVLAEARHGRLSLVQLALAIAVTVALSSLSVRFVENPVRFSPKFISPPSKGLLLGAGITAASVAVVGMLWASKPDLGGSGTASSVVLVPVQAPVTDGAGTEGTGTSATGTATSGTGAPAATDPPAGLAAIVANAQGVLAEALTVNQVPANLTPALGNVADDKARIYADDCVNIGVDAKVNINCRYGDTESSTTYVLFGDSHAAQWFPAMEAIAKDRGAELIVLTKGGCPTADVPLETNTLGRTCPAWKTEAFQVIAQAKPAMVVVAAQSRYFNSDAEWQAGLTRTLKKIAPHTKDLVVLSDNPGASDIPANCLSEHMGSATACNNRRERAIDAGRTAAEAAAAAATGARQIDPTDWLCTPQACPVMLGNTLLYRDADHLTTSGVTLLTPLLEAALVP